MKKRLNRQWTYMIVLFFLLPACAKKNDSHLVKFGGLTQGTTYQITYVDSAKTDYHLEIDSILGVIDRSLSVYNPQSVISKINRNETGSADDLHFQEVFKRSMNISKRTGGAFDVTVGPLINAWGFGFKRKEKISDKLIDSIRAFIGYEKVSLENGRVIKADPRIQLDFNAIAQGYTVDVVAAYLESKNIRHYLIEIGGEVLGRGNKPGAKLWHVGIEKPEWGPIDKRSLQAILSLENRAIATSGNYRKFFEENGVRYSHTIDPKTGYPAKNRLLSVSVLAADCATADGYATAFMVMGLERSLKFLKTEPALDTYFIYSDTTNAYAAEMTSGFRRSLQGEFYSNEQND